MDKLKTYIKELKKEAKNYDRLSEINEGNSDGDYYQGLSEAYDTIANKLERIIKGEEWWKSKILLL